jgi:hypothetical protein
MHGQGELTTGNNRFHRISGPCAMRVLVLRSVVLLNAPVVPQFECDLMRLAI